MKKYNQKYYLKNKVKLKEDTKQYKKNFPWKYVLFNIKNRCGNHSNKSYSDYGGRGIKCLITEEEIKNLWFRDKAYEMKQASIDRINNDRDYTLDNCRFIELSENVTKRNYQFSKIILQYDKQFNLIKEWTCLKLIYNSLGLDVSNIVKVCKNKQKTAYGYIWRYKSV